MKIKEFFKRMFTTYKENIKQYSATNIVIIVTTLILTLMPSNVVMNFSGEFLMAAALCALNFFVIETYTKDIKKRGIAYVFGVIIAIAINHAINVHITRIISRMVTGYCLIVLLLAIFKITKDSGEGLSKYILKVSKNLLHMGITYIILNIGLTAILFVLEMLLLDGSSFIVIMLRMQTALLGLFLLPATIMAVTDTKTEVTKFIDNIVCFVLLPLILLATAIIYIYMAKIFILKQIPKNAIFRILSVLFIVSFPEWIALESYKEKNKIINKLCKLLPIAFIPFIGLQVYSIGVRCAENGLTPIRYLGIIFIIFEAIAIFLNIYKYKKYVIHIYTTAIILIAVVTICPIINMQTISNINQGSRLDKAWTEGKGFEELDEREQDIIVSAYSYLKKQEDGEKYIPKRLSRLGLGNVLQNRLDPYKATTCYSTKSASYMLDSNGVVSVEGYKLMSRVIETYNDLSVEHLEDLNLRDEIYINLKQYIQNVANENRTNSSTEYISKNKLLTINENVDFCITEFNIRYEEDEKNNLENIEYLRIVGYLLVK